MIIHDALGPFVVGVTADLFRSVLCLMVFRLCLAECRLQLAQIGHDPNPPPEGRQWESHNTSSYSRTPTQFVTFAPRLDARPLLPKFGQSDGNHGNQPLI